MPGLAHDSLQMQQVVSAQALPQASRAELGQARMRALFQSDHTRVFRVLRRLGVQTAAAAEDLAQEVFVIAAQRLNDLRPGFETAFLLGTARKLAASWRRRASLEQAVALDEAAHLAGSPAAGPEEALTARRNLALLDATLAELDEDTRAVFVLFELEGLQRDEVASIVGIPPGTAASRLLRARQQFLAAAKRLKARLDREEGGLS
jgi:RNA polymerase sigma-70 factor (ECF subfamily)